MRKCPDALDATADYAVYEQRRKIVKALSIRQPWAWLILNGGKDIENRDWWTGVRGRVIVHASKGMTRDEYEDAFDTAAHINPTLIVPPFPVLERGGIVGTVNIIDCVKESNSPWFFGKYGFRLTDPEQFPFLPWKGQLGFFEIPFPPLPQSRSKT
jgi:hypothetical protein